MPDREKIFQDVDMADSRPFSVCFLTRGFDCGYNGFLKPFSFANWMQEAACEHAELLGLGTEALKIGGMTWMLSGMDVRIDSLPAKGDNVIIETWPVGLKRLYSLRAFRVKNEFGASLFRAIYAYLIVNIEPRRLVRPERILNADVKFDEPLPFFDFSFSPMKADDPEYFFSLSTRPSHIDHNNHVNNAYIIDWLLDAAINSGRVKKQKNGIFPKSFRIEFCHEILCNDELAVWKSSKKDKILTEIRRSDSVVARAEILLN